MRTRLPKLIGSPVRRREDPALITGEAKYVADIELPGVAHMALARSPYAHAMVRKIDTARAGRLEGVLAIVAAADVNPHLKKPLPVAIDASEGRFEEIHNPGLYPLAADRVRHVGEPVAAVLAESAALAADAAAAIEVDYEPLPVVTDPETALARGAPLVHEALGTNRGFLWTLEGGNVEKAFAKAKTSIELRAHIQRLIPCAIEPRAVAAQFDSETARFTVWSSTQIPHGLRGDLAGILGVPKQHVRVIAPEVGGGFGAKLNVYGEEVLVPFLARRSGRPVKWVASRMEDFLATTHGRDQHGVLSLAADERGRVTGARLSVVVDVGSHYSGSTPSIPPLTGVMMTGVYDIRSVRAEAVGVFTNKAPTEPYRGAGRPEAAYLIERAMDLLAATLGLDPAEVRRRNFIPKERFPYKTATGLTYDSGDYSRALDEALKRVDYEARREEQARRRREGGRPLGIGISCYVEICGFGPWEAGTVKVGPEGKVTVLTGTSPHGQGHETSWAQIAADILQVPIEDVSVLHGDTAVVRRGIGTFGSRSAPVGGTAVWKSAEQVRDGAKEIAAHLLEADAADLTLNEGRFHVVGAPSRSLGWKEVAAAGHDAGLPPSLGGKLAADTRFEPEGETYPFGAHVCVVEIDPETGVIAVLRYVSVDDCGRVINPLLVEGQVHGGIAQGMGQAFWEGASYDSSGNLITGSLMEYALPRADLLPLFETSRTETPTPLNPLGVKGIGEAATIGSTPAIVNAVVDALSPWGVRHLDTPLTPEKVWRALSSARS